MGRDALEPSAVFTPTLREPARWSPFGALRAGFRWLESECAQSPRWTKLIKSPRVSNIDQIPAPRSVQCSLPTAGTSVTESSVALRAPSQSRFHQPIFLTQTGPADRDATNQACCIRKLRRDRHEWSPRCAAGSMADSGHRYEGSSNYDALSSLPDWPR